MRSRGGLLALSGAPALLLAACAIAPPPEPVEIRDQALEGIAIRDGWSETAKAGEVAAGWVATFADARLDGLVAEAVARNLDLRVAATRVEQAEAYARAARAALKPVVSVLGRASVESGGDLSSGLYGGLLNVSWELDLWGRLRYRRNAAGQDAAAARADLLFARQSLAAAVARGWFLAIETRLQLASAAEMVAFADRYAGLTAERARVGVGSEKDAALARADLATVRDGAVQLELAHRDALRALELLLGRYPAAELEAATALPALPSPPPAGLPLEVLERRPDLVAAERRVAAAFDRVGEAKAARLPKLSLSAGLGVIDSDTFELQEGADDPSLGGAATLLAPIYQGGALKEQVTIRTAEQREALADYARRAVAALGEVEGALAAERALGERMALLATALAENRKVLEMEEVAFRVGRSDLRFVQQSRLALEASRVALLRVESERLIQRTRLHLALGGGFELPPPPAEPADDTPAS